MSCALGTEARKEVKLFIKALGSWQLSCTRLRAPGTTQGRMLLQRSPGTLTFPLDVLQEIRVRARVPTAALPLVGGRNWRLGAGLPSMQTFRTAFI